MPELDTAIWQNYQGRDLVVLGMSGDGLFGQESRELVEGFRDQSGVTFPLVLNDQTRAAYGRPETSISPYPFDVILDRRGRIRYTSAKLDVDGMRRVIDELLAEE